MGKCKLSLERLAYRYRDLSTFESIASAIRKLPIFIERDSTGHGMYNAALVKFARYLTSGKPITTASPAIVEVPPHAPGLVSIDAWSNTARRMVKPAQQTTNASNGKGGFANDQE